MYEIAKLGLEDIKKMHRQEKMTKRQETGEKPIKVELDKQISTHEADYRTWKDIKEVRSLRTRLHNYLKKYEGESIRNIYPNETTQETTHAPITLQQAHDSMREFIMNGDVESFCKKHKNMQREYISRLEVQLWSLKKGKKNIY